MVVQAGARAGRRGDLYPEQPWAVAAFRGNDLVTRPRRAPVLAVAMLASRRDASSASVLVWLGMLHYGVYNYAYYSFGGGLQLGLPAARRGVRRPRWPRCSCSATSIDAGRGRPRCRRRHPRRGSSRFSPRSSASRSLAAWGGLSVRFALTGDLPAGRHAALGGAPRLCHRPVPARAGVRRRRRPAVAPRAVGVGPCRRDQRERCGLPRRAVGGRRVPGGCRDRRHDLALTGRDRLGARLPGARPWPCSSGCSRRRTGPAHRVRRGSIRHLTSPRT